MILIQTKRWRFGLASSVGCKREVVPQVSVGLKCVPKRLINGHFRARKNPHPNELCLYRAAIDSNQ